MASGLAALAPLAGILKGIGGATDIQSQQAEMERRRQLMALAQLQEQRESQQYQQQQQINPAMFRTLMSGGVGQGQQQPQQTPMQPIPLLPGQGGGPGAVKGSWFGNAPGWSDPNDSGLQASGKPVSSGPGIALPSRATLGQNFDVTAPSGQTMRLPQTDIGPAKWTGRGVDINAPAAQAFGYTPGNFPTDQTFVVKTVSDIRSDLPPRDQAVGQVAAQRTMGQFPNPTAFAGRLDAQGLARAIKQANPGISDEAAMGAFTGLFGMLTKDSQQQFAQAWDIFKFGAQQSEKKQEHDDLSRYRSQEVGLRERELAGQEAGRAQTKAHQEATEAEAAKYHATLGQGRESRAAEALAKKRAPIETKVNEQESLANDAEELRKMIEANPTLTGVKGMVGRAIGTVKENVLGTPEDPDVAAFSNRVNMLQARLQKTLLGSRYYSGLAQQKLDQIVPALKAGVAPSQAKSALDDVVRTLRSEARQGRDMLGKTALDKSDYSTMTPEELQEEYNRQTGDQ